MSIISRHQPNQTKAQAYGRYLDSVRSASLWLQETPITLKGTLIGPPSGLAGPPPSPASLAQPAPPSDGLTWPELIRKFLKHNPDRSATAELVTCELAVRSIILSNHRQQLQDEGELGLDSASAHHGVQVPLFPSVKTQEARELIQKHTDKLSHLKSTIIKDGISFDSQNIELHKLDPSQLRSILDLSYAHTILGLAFYHLEIYDQALEVLSSCPRFGLPEKSSHTNLERYDVISSLIRLALMGLAQGRMQSTLTIALETHRQVVEHYDRCLNYLAIGSGDKFHDELHHWFQLSMCSYSMLAEDQTPGVPALEVHRAFYSRSRYFLSCYHHHAAGRVYMTYLNLLLKTIQSQAWRISNDSNGTPYKPLHQTRPAVSKAWRSETLAILKTFELFLRKATHFPKSGSVNQPVLEFADILFNCYKSKHHDLDFVNQLIQILNRSTQLTFHSHRILRYLIHLLDYKKDWAEVEINLDLYIQLFSTAKATGNFHSKVHASSSTVSVDESSGLQAGDYDSEKQFIETVILGSRVLMKYMNNYQKALQVLDRAYQIFDSSQDLSLKSNFVLMSRILRMKGIATGGIAHEADREVRPELHKSYLSLLTQAAELDPTSFENLYHLAYAQAELRDIDSALISARKAVEINADSKPCWHLLGLITSASKEFKLALDIVEVGLSNGELRDEDEVGLNDDCKSNTSVRVSVDRDSEFGADSQDHRPSKEDGTEAPIPLNQTPSKSNQLSVPSAPMTRQSSRSRLSLKSSVRSTIKSKKPELEFNYDDLDELLDVIHLRMTKNVLIESVDGCEMALADQQDLFSFFAKVSSRFKSQSDYQSVSDQLNVQDESENSSREISPSDRTSVAGLSPSRSMLIRSRLKGRRTSLDAKTTLGPGVRAPSRSTSHSIRSYLHSSHSLNEKPPLSGLSRPTSLIDNSGEVEGEKKIKQVAGGHVGKEEERISQQRKRILQDLWLMSASTFRRWGKLDECKGALQEAEKLDPNYSQIWVQFGLYCFLMNDIKLSKESLLKSVEFEDQNLSGMIHLARILKEEQEREEDDKAKDKGSIDVKSRSLLKSFPKDDASKEEREEKAGARSSATASCPKLEVCEHLVDFVIENQGWDSVEGWYLRSEIYHLTNRVNMGFKYLNYSLDLEESRPIRCIKQCLSRCL